MQRPMGLTKKPFYPWLIWALGAGFFLSEYFARVSPSIMVPELMQAFHVRALSLGTLSVYFYYTYVGVQIPVGALVDRFGAHKLLTVTALLCAMGCFLFAVSEGLHAAEMGRLLMGLGAAFSFVGTLKLATIWFPSSRFGLLAGLTQALGMLGAAIGEGPFASLVGAIGWRETMWLIGGVLLVLAILIGILVRDTPGGRTEVANNRTSTRDLINGLGVILRNRQTWINAFYAGLIFAPTAAFAEMWGVTYLQHNYGLSLGTAAYAVAAIFIGWAVGGPFTGWISDRMRRRRPSMIASAGMSVVMMSAVLYFPHISTPVLFLFCFMYGFANTGVVSAYAVASEINPRAVTGVSIAFANMVSVLVGAGFQPIIGWLLDLQWDGRTAHGVPVYTAQDFRYALSTMIGCLVLGFIVAFFVKETYCQPIMEKDEV